MILVSKVCGGPVAAVLLMLEHRGGSSGTLALISDALSSATFLQLPQGPAEVPTQPLAPAAVDSSFQSVSFMKMATLHLTHSKSVCLFVYVCVSVILYLLHTEYQNIHSRSKVRTFLESKYRRY